ncbi:hypothetical protein IEO70_14385 [Bacillus sp. AGMB 02131]|uniref:Uncharacterized protein n=1 Tax=Peribacillus faecalis TaxID=2772559 RepID=A0A927CXH4_9BACI|nr:hypothetical protein [Peribacillus faecalis]MBD3109533.1 hypothetical protein [Peribacillus faecalis]
MSLRFKVIIMTSTIAIFGTIFLVHEMLHARKVTIFLQETPAYMIEDLNFDKYISEITYVKEEDRLHYDFELTEEIEKLSTMEKFAVFHIFSKQLRFRIINTDQMEQLLHEDFYITATVNDEVLEFEVLVSDKPAKLLNTKDTLRINNEIAYTIAEYLDDVTGIREQMEIEYVNGYSEWEIMEFAIRMHKLITIDGTDVKELSNASRLVTDAVLEEFGITYDQYIAIYKKYYLDIHTRS